MFSLMLICPIILPLSTEPVTLMVGVTKVQILLGNSAISFLVQCLFLPY